MINSFKRNFNKLSIILILLMISQISIFASTEKIQIYITTGSIGSSVYPLGGGIAELISKNVDNVFCTAVTSGGVDENMNRIKAGKADIGFSSTGDAYLAFRGLEPYAEKYDNMRQLGIMWPQYGEPYTLKSTGIKTYLDLKDKVVCAGTPGGSKHKSFFDWVKIHGLDPEKDFKRVVYLPSNDAMEALKLGQVDAVMEISGIPTAAMMELSLTREIEIIRFAPGYIEKLIKEKPKYSPIIIPAGTYRGINEDIETVGMSMMIICKEDLPEEIAYQIVKTIYSTEGLNYLQKIHSIAKDIHLEQAANLTPIPLHPGAERYFKEVGILK